MRQISGWSNGDTERDIATRTISAARLAEWSACRRDWREPSFISRPIGAWSRGSLKSWQRSATPKKTSISLLPGSNGDFDAGLADQFGNADGGAGRAGLGEYLGVDAVHVGKQFHIRQIDLDGDGVGKGETGGFEDLAHVVECLFYFVFKLLGIDAFLVGAGLTRNVEGSVGEDCRGERPAGGGAGGHDRLFLGIGRAGQEEQHR